MVNRIKKLSKEIKYNLPGKFAANEKAGTIFADGADERRIQNV